MSATEPTHASALIRYGALRAPLALLELPLFVLLPAYYAERLGLELAAVGSVLFAARALDAVADPLIGASLDRQADLHRWRRIIWLALPVLVLAYAALFFPPDGVSIAAWLAITSVMTYLAWSVVSITHQAWGARLGDTDAQRVRVTAWREGAGLVGVLASAALLVPDRVPALVTLFALGALGAGVLLAWAPMPAQPSAGAQLKGFEPQVKGFESQVVGSGHQVSGDVDTHRHDGHRPITQADSPWQGFAQLWRDTGVRWTLIVFLVNGIASAIPATLLLFFVSDILRTPELTPQFLLSYFVAAAVGMPVWARLSARLGLKAAWLLGMAISIAAFIWAWGLGAGDSTAFFVVCIATGFALGADLAVPPALLATVLAAPQAPKDRNGAAFGLWNLATKFNLAAAAGLALPALGLLGYVPGGAESARGAADSLGSGALDAAQGMLSGATALALMYAVLPCLLKLLAGLVLMLAPIPRSSNTR